MGMTVVVIRHVLEVRSQLQNAVVGTANDAITNDNGKCNAAMQQPGIQGSIVQSSQDSEIPSMNFLVR